MKKISKTAQRRFVDEIYMLNHDSDFAGTFVIALKGAITFKKVEKILNNKFIAYNYAYSNLFIKYKILPDNLYDILDKFYNEKPLHDFIKDYLNNLHYSKYSKNKFIDISANIINKGLILSHLSIPHLVIFQYAVKAKWDNFKIETLQFASEYSEELAENEFKI